MPDAAVKEATLNMDENENIFRSCLEADRHVSFLTAFEEEEDVGGQHSFLGTACSRDLNGGHLSFGAYELPNCFGVENFSSGFEYEEMTLDQDALDSTIVAEVKAKTEIINEVLQGTDEGTKHVEGSLECLSGKCDNETSSDAATINNGQSVKSFVGKISIRESTEGRDCDADEQYLHLESCFLTESCHGRDFSKLGQMTVRELQDAFRTMFGRETKIRDKQWLKRRIFFGIQNSGEVHKPLNSEVLGATSDENDDKSTSMSATESALVLPCSPKLMPNHENKVFAEMKQSASDSSVNYSPEGNESGISLHCKDEKDSDIVKVKRVHKPPRRYIEETIEVKPQRTPKKSSVSCKRPRDRLVDDQLHKQREEKVDENPRLVLRAGSFDGCIQVPFGLPVEDENTQETASRKVSNITAKGYRPTISTMSREPASPPAKLQIVSKTPPKLHVFIPKELATISPVQKGMRRRKHQEVPVTTSPVQKGMRRKKHQEEPVTTSPVQKGMRRKKHQEEPVTTSPVQKGMRRRKHHISWTLSEVMRLIEGVSHLGVGRWSKIKRLLFATAKHRTSVDLKDKWRNLVKASTHLRRRKKGMQARKLVTHQAPESVLRRVQELADSRE